MFTKCISSGFIHENWSKAITQIVQSITCFIHQTPVLLSSTHVCTLTHAQTHAYTHTHMFIGSTTDLKKAESWLESLAGQPIFLPVNI